nr:hypothetical protein [Adhaeribacter arboris]
MQLIILAGSLFLLWHWKKDLRSFFASRKKINGYKVLYYVILFTFSILILIHAAQPATNPDTGLYHAQTIKWLNTCRIVPGLGNLYGPLALNSHAHLLMSFFNFSFITTKILNQTWSSFIFLLYCSYALREGFRSFKYRPVFSIYYFGSLFWGMVFFRNWISSPTPDTGVMFFFFFLFGVLLTADRSRKLSWQVAFMFFLLPVVISFKLSAIFSGAAGLAWLLLIRKQVNSRFIQIIVLQGLFVLVPYCTRNVILTGHILYPLPALNLFNFDWVVPQPWLSSYQEGVAAYSRVPTVNWSFYVNKPFINWIPVWWVNQDKPVQIFMLILVILLPFIIWRVIRNIKFKLDLVLSTVWLSALIASLAWFFFAPAPRFGFGYLVPTLLIGTILLVRGRISFKLGLFMGLLLGIYALNGIYKQVYRQAFSFIWPAGYPTPITEIRQIGKIKIRVALGIGRCYNLLPCTVPEPHPGLERRGEKLEDGFRISKN